MKPGADHNTSHPTATALAHTVGTDLWTWQREIGTSRAFRAPHGGWPSRTAARSRVVRKSIEMPVVAARA